MRQAFSLTAGISQDRAAGGHFIAASRVSGFVTVTTNTGRVYQLESGNVVYPDGGYQSLSVESNTDQQIVLLCGYGRFEQVAEKVEAIISGIVKTEMINEISAKIDSAVDVSGSRVEVINQLAAEIVGLVDVTGSEIGISGLVDVTGSDVGISGAVDVSGSQVEILNQITAAIAGNVAVTQAGAWSAEVTNTVQTKELLASSVTEHPQATLTNAGDSSSLAVNANRRDAVVIAPDTNTGALTVTGGYTLSAGQRVTLERFTGAVTATADTAGDKVQFIEWVR